VFIYKRSSADARLYPVRAINRLQTTQVRGKIGAVNMSPRYSRVQRALLAVALSTSASDVDVSLLDTGRFHSKLESISGRAATGTVINYARWV
jgi:hypothetical protein